MDLQSLLAAILNPNGTQQAVPPMAAAQVGDHNNPNALQTAFSRPQSAPVQQPPQQPLAFQAPQAQPMPQNAPQAAPVSSDGGLGGILGEVFAPKTTARNRTTSWLQSRGLDPGTATVLASDKDALRSYILQRSKGGGLTEFDQRAQAAQQYGLDPRSEEGRNFILSGNLPEARGGASELGLNPQYGVDDQGNPVLLQLGKDGKVVRSQLPQGVTLSKTPIKVDLGTSWGLIDPITRQMIGTTPKDIAGAAAQTKIGEAQGAAQFDLPRVEQNAELITSVLDRMKAHPGRTGKTGFFQGMLPAMTPSQVDFQSLVDQTQGQAFLQAFNSLKGGGQITEIEGKKATDAISRLGNERLSDEDYLQAINDLESVVNKTVERAKQQAGGKPQASGGGGNTFTSNKDVFDAISAGKLKIGDEIILNGKRMRVDP